MAAAAALLVLIWALANGFWPTWPLWTMVALLGVGLLGGPLGQVVGGWAVHRIAQLGAAVAVLLVLTFSLPAPHTHWQISPLWMVALLLGLGLVVDPLAKLVNRHSAQRSVQPIAVIAALIVLIHKLAIVGYFFYTSSSKPEPLHTYGKLPMGAIRVAAVLLCVGFVAGQLVIRPTPRRSLQATATAAALFVLLVTLASPPAGGIHPESQLRWMAAMLIFGLVADPILAFIGRPHEKVLAERVSELSRTRRGALDVQATELRRIERDLHDGAQVRLVALSLKLGRAEERYRDDPATAALLREARGDTLDAIRELRELARGIAPPVLTDRGLEAAVRSLAQRSGSEVSVTSKLKRRPLPAVETAAYFVVAESLTNAAKHAAGASVVVRLYERGGDLFVEVTDSGPGGADPSGGGLNGLRQRVEALDGALHVRSRAGAGTQVEAVMSCGW
jgi:signal transduction histidine kinase